MPSAHIFIACLWQADYFGYARCGPTLFTTRPYHAQNYNEGNVHGRGNKAVLRYQLTDSGPFFILILN
jgi:hypothetical protein